MAKIPFTVSARTAKLIGQENFANAEGAVIELVKNAYDADADTAIIIFDSTDESADKHAIYIIDNGHGMTRSVVREKWMRIGTDDKLQNFTSAGGRIKTGAKGIGRFALDRLGERARMLSTTDTDKSLYWAVNWKDFEAIGVPINAINARLYSLKDIDLERYIESHFSKSPLILDLVKNAKFSTGTLFKITNLKDLWDENTLTSLFDNLEVLIPPAEQPDFDIFLFNVGSLADYGKVNSAFYDDYDYRVSAAYSANDDQTLQVTVTRNELDLEALENSYKELFEFDLMKKFPFDMETMYKKDFNVSLKVTNLKGFSSVNADLLKKIGDFDFTFYFLKNRPTDDRSESDLKKYPYRKFVTASRMAWLEKFGGVKIFRDGFRVRPYGENGDDWLKLGERQARNPQAVSRLGTYRIRPNQIAGTVNISRINNRYFNDKSGREGIQENDIFLAFKNLLIEIINLFERDRNVIMFHLSELARIRFDDENERELAKAEAERILREDSEISQKDAVNRKPSTVPKSRKNSDTEVLLASATQKYEQELEEKESEIQLLRSLASIGLIVSSAAHELTSLRQRIVPRTDFLLRELKKYIPVSSLADVNREDNPFYMIELMKEEDLKLKHWLDYSLNSLKKDRRKRANVNFGNYFENFKNTWKRSLIQRNVTLSLRGTKDARNTIQAFEVDLDAIFNNLLTNSFEALKRGKDKQVTIAWNRVNEFIYIEFIDNGRGLAPEYTSDPSEIFNPHETSKRDSRGNIIGTGLGLYIVKSIITDYKDASIEVVKADAGFRLRLAFPVRKK